MELVTSVIHVLTCILIIGVILIQSGKGGGLGAGLGGANAAAQQIFGGRGAGNFLTRTTVGLAVIFMATSIFLAYLSSRPRSLLDLSETSGVESSQEETIIEEGSGPLVELDGDGPATGDAADAAGEGSAQPITITPTMGEDGQMKLELPDNLFGTQGDAPAEGTVEGTAAEAPADDDAAPAEAPPTPQAAPTPRAPAAKQVAEPDPEPPAEKPAAEENPAPKAQPAEEAAPTERAELAADPAPAAEATPPATPPAADDAPPATEEQAEPADAPEEGADGE